MCREPKKESKLWRINPRRSTEERYNHTERGEEKNFATLKALF